MQEMIECTRCGRLYPWTHRCAVCGAPCCPWCGHCPKCEWWSYQEQRAERAAGAACYEPR